MHNTTRSILALRKCSCFFNCQRYDSPEVVCSWRKFPISECLALAKACEQQMNIAIKPFDYEQYRRVKTCKKVGKSGCNIKLDSHLRDMKTHPQRSITITGKATSSSLSLKSYLIASYRHCSV